MTWEFRRLPGKFRLLPGKFRLSLFHVFHDFAYVSCFSCAFMFSRVSCFSYVSCAFFHVALLCFHVFNVAFICFMFFICFRFFMWLSCVSCFNVCLSNCAISCSYLQFSIWIGLQKRPPQVRFDLPEMQVLKGEAGLVGVIFRRPIQVEN